MKTMTLRLVAALAATAALAAPSLAQSRAGGGSVATPAGSGQGWHNGGPSFRGGYNGSWGHRGYGGHRGYWGPGPFWGGLGLGIGFGAIAFSAPYYGGYYGGYSGGYYAYRGYLSEPGVAGYVVVEPQPGDRVVRSAGQPVPPATRAPEPIFYPRSGQTPAQTETDVRDCNRWATTQVGAMSDASIFQRATLACMEGRGYTVK